MHIRGTQRNIQNKYFSLLFAIAREWIRWVICKKKQKKKPFVSLLLYGMDDCFRSGGILVMLFYTLLTHFLFSDKI